MANSKVSFSIELLKMNLKHHKFTIKQNTLPKKHGVAWSEEVLKNNRKRIAKHQAYVDDLKLAIKKLSSVGKSKKKKLP